MIFWNCNHCVIDLPKKEKQKKKNWREKQRERQRAQEAYETHRAREAQKKPRKYPKGKIVFGICLIGLIFVAYVAWQSSSKPPSSTDGSINNQPLTGFAPNFALTDINGAPFSLSQQAGKVIVIHFMAVSCGGGIVQTNENQLRTLKSVCSTYCGQKSVAVVTVAATTCAVSCLETIRSDYAVTWTLGNDYDDGKADIVNAYSSYSIADGAIVLIDRNFKIAKVYTEETTFETLSSRISQLL
jgi:cytochrome oxidase Cu insertion factor (SCO1/SenC/PrrC family)